MSAASSARPSGAGFNFFRPSTAFVTIPFLGPLLAGRSNSTTGTLTLTRWAAICAPITPAPSTATLRTWNRLTLFLSRGERGRPAGVLPPGPEGLLFGANPGLRAPEHRRTDVAAHVQLLAAVGELEDQLVAAALGRVEDHPAGPLVGLFGVLLRAAQDDHADDRLVLALVLALDALVGGL